jgi:hypothetical protein
LKSNFDKTFESNFQSLIKLTVDIQEFD